MAEQAHARALSLARLSRLEPRLRRTLVGGGAGVGLTFASAVTSGSLEHYLDVHSPSMIFMCAPVLAALWFGRNVALFTAVFAFLVYNLYLVDPPGTFGFAGFDDVFRLLIFVGAALLVGGLAGRVHDERERARERARIFGSLFAISRRMIEGRGGEEAFELLVGGVRDIGASEAIVLQRDDGAGCVLARAPIWAAAPREVLNAAADALSASGGGGDFEVGLWRLHRMDHGKSGGALLAWKPLPGAKDEGHAIAVRLLAELAAISIESARLTRQKIELEAMAATERLRTALMSSISHDFRTPLATILASASSLSEFGERLTPETRADMLTGIQEEAERLNRFIRNILDMTRLEADVLKPRQEWTDPLEILETAAERVRKRLGARKLQFATPAAAPSIYVDRILAEQAITNVLENAIVHTPFDAAIRMGSDHQGETVSLWVEDDGPGVAPSQLERIFDKFQRLGDSAAAPHGVGLGLAISKGFVEAMSGKVTAMSPARGERGLRVEFTFPCQIEGARP